MQTAHYDPDADVAFFRVRGDPVIYVVEQDWGALFGYNDAGVVVSIEIWFAGNTLPEPLVAALPGRGADERGSPPGAPD